MGGRRLLPNSDDLYRAVVAAMAEGVVVQDASSVILACNEAAERLLGLTANQMMGRTSMDPRWHAIHEDGSPFPGDTHPVPVTLRTGQPQQDVVMGVHKPDGTLTWISINSQPFFRSGDDKPYAALCTFTDLTARKLAEEALRRSEQHLEDARRLEAIGRLAGGIAHDFNNLLTAIMASLHFAELGPPDVIAGELASIRVASERGAALTHQLIAFARRQPIQLEHIGLDQLVRGLEPMLRRLVGEHIELSTELAGDLWDVRGAKSQLEQVILNLVANARDAMPAGGRVTVRTANVSLANGDHAVLTVTDEGHGIANDALHHIFEPFFTTKQAGTGLGLASCHGIVCQLGGDIVVHSSEQGTTFEVRLPRAAAPCRIAEPVLPRATTRPPERRTLLFIDDDDLVRSAVSRGLSEHGFEVLVAAGADEALALADRHTGSIDAVITDIVLPHVSGTRLADVLQQRRPGMRVIFVSGYNDEPLANLAPRTDRSFLPKPFTIDALVERIRAG